MLRDTLLLKVCNFAAPLLRRLRYLKRVDVARAFEVARKGDEPAISPTAKTVLLVPFRVTPAAQWFEGVVSYIFKQRSIRPISIFCNQAVRRCEQFVVTENAAVSCALCRAEAHEYRRAFALEAVWIQTLVGHTERETHRRTAATICLRCVPSYEYRNVCIGAQVVASLSRYLLRGDVDLRKYEPIVREYVYTALVTADAAYAALERYRPSLVILSHGIYSTWGTFLEVCKRQSVPTIVWGTQYRKYCFVLAHNRSYHEDLLREPSNTWADRVLTTPERTAVLTYVEEKGKGPSSVDYISYYKTGQVSSSTVALKLNLDVRRPCIGLFPNLAWDAQLVYGKPVFSSMAEWIVETVRWFDAHRDRDLIIRAHPAEIRGVYVTQETVDEILCNAFRSLPSNVHYVKPGAAITSYEVSEIIRGALVYGTKFGLELVLRRKPVVVAGESYYRNKGFTFDPDSKESYFHYLEEIPEGTSVTDSMYETALKYAYHYNFRRMFPIPLAECEGTRFVKFLFDNVKQLERHQNAQLDNFVERCLGGIPFIYDRPPAEDIGD